MQATPKLATYADLLAMPEDARAEIIGGQIQLLPAPRPRHSQVQGSLRRFVGGPFHDDDGFGGPGGWWIFLEVDVAFGPHDILRPDAVGFRRARLTHPDERPFTVVPDWVCEVISPSTASRDKVLKSHLYAKHGVSWYWMIDPADRTLQAYQLVDGRWSMIGAYDDEATARVAPFEAIELPVGRLFLPREEPAPNQD